MFSRKRPHRLPRGRRVRSAALLLEDLERRIVLSTPSVRLNLEIARPPGFHVEGAILNPAGGIEPLVGGSPTPVGFTPAQIRTAYGINNIVIGGVTGDGTGQTIAIVDAYDDPAFPDSTSSGFSSSDLASSTSRSACPTPRASPSTTRPAPRVLCPGPTRPVRATPWATGSSRRPSTSSGRTPSPRRPASTWSRPIRPPTPTCSPPWPPPRACPASRSSR